MCDRSSAEFTEAANDWNLDKLYADLAQAKQVLAAYKRRELTETEKLHLRGLLCGYSPAAMAQKLHKTPRGVEADLSKTLYRYVENLSKRNPNSLSNWRNIIDWLAEYRKSPSIKPYQDWGEAPDVPVFFGRQEELKTLKEWILSDRCRLLTMFGMGGIGKTALTVKLIQQLQDSFEFVIWRSLRHAPPFEEILTNLILSLSQRVTTDYSLISTISLSRLIEYLRKHRCLIVLDNYEGVLRGGNLAGQHLQGYEKYGELLRIAGQSNHQSCLVITSREKPQEFISLSREGFAVRCKELDGLKLPDAQELLQVQGLSYQKECGNLIDSYRGNPLALKLVCHTIKNLFEGNIKQFLAQNTLVIGEIFRNLLDEQFDRLSVLEKEIMYWLAIENRLCFPLRMQEKILLTVSRSESIEALESLSRRSLVEKNIEGESVLFTLQPLVMRYVTKHLIVQVYEEILQAISYQNVDNFERLRNHALVTSADEDSEVNAIQLRLIITPIKNKLKEFFREESRIAYYFNQILFMLQDKSPHFVGYARENILNLLK
ncbi:NB-ARC domain-containing protein [Argonema antarcticum]|uniref:NB-ARC domain-containing protein n=1 Tax=Argonema antarcticum TaxID=2942763 RepID=UPI0020134DBB|nr:NB-ARC domain-containing protein [Argonema antarcticum]MCL1471934.1 hypothetical protein [Argonema antarcticum A004/B2]